MKTINLRNASKVFLFLFLLCSAETFAFTKIPTGATSSGYESKYGCASQVKKTSKKTSKTYATASRGIALQANGKKCFKK